MGDGKRLLPGEVQVGVFEAEIEGRSEVVKATLTSHRIILSGLESFLFSRLHGHKIKVRRI